VERPIHTYFHDAGYITIQEIISTIFNLTYFVIKSERNSVFHYKIESGMFSLLLAVTGKLKANTVTNPNNILEKSQWQLLTETGSIEFETAATTSTEFILLSINISELTELNQLFPEFRNYLKKPENFQTIHYLPLETMEYINHILYCRLEGDWRQHFIENRVDDILFSLLVCLFGEKPFPEFNKEDLERIHQAQKLISADTGMHKSIRMLAEEIGMSKTKFKQLFKRVYHIPPSDYQRKIKLDLAISYLKKGFSVKESAYKSGWSPVLFINAFKEAYKITPGKYAKQNGKF
jgi:AraC-like DNA-binding protein